MISPPRFACTDSKTGGTPPPQLLAAYCLFLVSAGAVYHLVAEGAFSSILTLAVMVQCLSLVLLSLQIISSGSASGISANALVLDILAICFRLSSTLWLNGYLPVDATGDHIFQVIDACSLAILVWLLYQALVVKRDTYQAEQDSFGVLPLVLGAAFLAAVLHGDMNAKPVFDTLWMTGLFVGTVAVLPQLWLITRTGGRVEALTSHHIAAMVFSRALSGIFMWHARDDITCKPWIGDFNHAGWAILGAYFLNFILIGDFGYYYIKAVLISGLSCCVETEDCFV